jgi:hypothetical protein
LNVLDMDADLLSLSCGVRLCSKVFHAAHGTNARENKGMIDDGNDSTSSIDEPEFNLPPPRFDESAASNAQPVQPIGASRASAMYDRVAPLGRALTSGSRALVLVVIAGLVTGTLGGMAWVEERQVNDVPPTTNELSDVARENLQNEELHAEVSGVADLRSAGPMTSQSRKGRSRVRPNRARAYRVAVLH